MRSGFFAEDVLRILKPVIDKRVEIAAVDRRIERLQGELQSIVSDQQRLRENMKALRGSSEATESTGGEARLALRLGPSEFLAHHQGA
jgi:septation ring formation regulator EzrA